MGHFQAAAPRTQLQQRCRQPRAARYSEALLIAYACVYAVGAAAALDCRASPQLCAELSITATAVDLRGGSAGSNLPPLLVSLISIAPPIGFLGLQMSGFPTIQRILADGTTGALSPLPFVSLLANCTVWSLYGLLKSDLTVLLPNGIGLCTGAYYTYVFNKHTARPIGTVLGGAATIIAVAVVAATVLPAEKAAGAMGWGGSCLAVCLMASPLATMQTVLRERSTRALPFATSAATFANATLWTAYGLLVSRDPFVYVPNVLGMAAGAVQLALFARFGIYRGPPKGEDTRV